MAGSGTQVLQNRPNPHRHYNIVLHPNSSGQSHGTSIYRPDGLTEKFRTTKLLLLVSIERIYPIRPRVGVAFTPILCCALASMTKCSTST